MGKKGTKRKTRWRALPLGDEDGGSGNEEELLDEDPSATSSVVGQPQYYNKTHPMVFKMGEKPYRQTKRFPYDRFRSKEPLIKLESKTFDEEEYTKITTPRQDVLFKKGYFGRKRESSIEESVHNTGEIEVEETVMDQIIITNGFVDERGHYLVNGNSYEIYDPYTNTVTVVVGPPPYANGVTQPVLAAVSCQPVPLQPVDWYPQSNDWPQGPSWTPSYHQNHHSDSVSSPVQSCDSTPTSIGSEGHPSSSLYHHPAYVIPPGYVFNEPPVFNVNGLPIQDGMNPTTEAMCSNDNTIDKKLKKTRRKTSESKNEEEKTTEKKEESDSDRGRIIDNKPDELNNFQSTAIETSTQKTNSSLSSAEDNKVSDNASSNSDCQATTSNSANETSAVENKELEPIEIKKVEKQSHSTQTNLPEHQKLPQSNLVRVKESHSTQTTPEEAISNGSAVTEAKTDENAKNNKNLSDILLRSLTKNDEEAKVSSKPSNKLKEIDRNSPKKPQEESPRKIYQKRTNFNDEKKLKMADFQQAESIMETSPSKMSYARKVMNGLENINGKDAKTVNGVVQTPNDKQVAMNGSNSVVNGSGLNGNVLSPKPNNPKQTVNGMDKTPVANNNNYNNNSNSNNSNNGHNNANSGSNNNIGFGYNNKYAPNDKYISIENKRNPSNLNKVVNGIVKNGYDKPRFNRSSSSSGKTSANERTVQKESKFKNQKIQLNKSPSKVVKEKCPEIGNESRSQSDKSSSVSELSSPTDLSSGQNTPPEKLIVKKMEQNVANEINKSVEEKLKQNLTENGGCRSKEIEERKSDDSLENPNADENLETVQNAKPKTKALEHKKKKKKAKTEDEKPKDTPKTNKPKKKRKHMEANKEPVQEVEDSTQEIPFLQSFIQEKSDDFMFNGWSDVKKDGTDLICDIDSLLTADDDDLLKSLGICNEKMNSTSKLPLGSDFLRMLPTFKRDRPKFKFEDYFAATSTKTLHGDLFTRTNIANMKSTKPEEFFASIVENPSNENGKSDKKTKEGTKNGNKKESVSVPDTATDKIETATKETNNGAQIIVKKGFNVPKTGYKINKNNVKCKTANNDSKNEEVVKNEEAIKKNEEKKEERLGIVEAVNTWLQEQGDSEKILSVNSLPQSFERVESEEDEEVEADEEDEKNEADQKNVTSNPLPALSVNSEAQNDGAKDIDKKDGGCTRVAKLISKDGFLDIDDESLFLTTAKKKKHFKNRKHRSSSLDAMLTDTKLKKFLTESANYCQDLIGDVRNGLTPTQFATEELCDPKNSVLKYYTLSPSIDLSKKSSKTEESDSSDNEVFDALEYKFMMQDVKNKNGAGNSSITDSGVHSESDLTENTEDSAGAAVAASAPVAADRNVSQHQTVSSKEVSCKLQ